MALPTKEDEISEADRLKKLSADLDAAITAIDRHHEELARLKAEVSATLAAERQSRRAS